VAKVADLLTMENMLSDASEMDEETHRVKQYESLPGKPESDNYHGKQREKSIRVTRIRCLDYQRGS
jgi:hypothetical protein